MNFTEIANTRQSCRAYDPARDVEEEKLNAILAKNTGRSIEEIARDTERDNYMTAQQALEYGLIDKIIEHH